MILCALDQVGGGAEKWTDCVIIFFSYVRAVWCFILKSQDTFFVCHSSDIYAKSDSLLASKKGLFFLLITNRILPLF